MFGLLEVEQIIWLEHVRKLSETSATEKPNAHCINFAPVPPLAYNWCFQTVLVVPFVLSTQWSSFRPETLVTHCKGFSYHQAGKHTVALKIGSKRLDLERFACGNLRQKYKSPLVV